MITQIKAKILKLINTLLKEGVSTKKISLCIALGVALGIFPVLGATTLVNGYLEAVKSSKKRHEKERGQSISTSTLEDI